MVAGMSIWIIISWVLVAILTGVNVFIFLKLKDASEQMLKMAFPGAKNMNEAVSQMQKMMGGVQGMKAPSLSPSLSPSMMGARGRGGNPFGGGKGGDAQLKQAMEMLQRMQKGQPKR